MEGRGQDATFTREALRAELDDTRSKYHALLGTIGQDTWNRKGEGAVWSVKELMWHVALTTEFIARMTNTVRQGRGFNPPAAILDRLNNLIARIGARNATPQSVAAKYDKAYQALIEALNEVQDEEWQREMNWRGEILTVERFFHGVVEHYEEHSAEVWQVVSSQSGRHASHAENPQSE